MWKVLNKEVDLGELVFSTIRFDPPPPPPPKSWSPPPLPKLTLNFFFLLFFFFFFFFFFFSCFFFFLFFFLFFFVSFFLVLVGLCFEPLPPSPKKMSVWGAPPPPPNVYDNWPSPMSRTTPGGVGGQKMSVWRGRPALTIMRGGGGEGGGGGGEGPPPKKCQSEGGRGWPSRMSRTTPGQAQKHKKVRVFFFLVKASKRRKKKFNVNLGWGGGVTNFWGGGGGVKSDGVDNRRTNIFPWSCKIGVHSKTMWNKQRYFGQLQNHVRIANFYGGIRKITIPSTYSYLFMVLWHGWSCKEVCGTILWVGKQDESTTQQSIYSMHRWSSFQIGRTEIFRRIAKSMLSNGSEMLVLGTYWKTWHSMVSKQTWKIDHKMDHSMWQTSESLHIFPSSHLIARSIERPPSDLVIYCIRKPGENQTSKKVKVLWVRKLRCMIERWNLMSAVTWVTSATDSLKKHTHQATQNGILIKLGLLKSGNLIWWMIERRDLLFALKEERTRLKHVSLVNTR